MAKKKIFKGKVKTAIKKAVQKIKTVGKKIVNKAEDVPFLVLMPFKGLMNKALARKGVQHGSSLHETAIAFSKHIAGKHFEETHDFEQKKCFDQVQMFSQPGVRILNNADAHYNIIEEAASGIIKGILEFIKGLKKKADSGQPLTDLEKEVLDQAAIASDAVEKAGQDLIEDDISVRIKDFLFSWKGGLTLVGIVLLILYATKKSGS